MLSLGLLVLRLVIGLLLFGHGTQKLFGWWGGGGLARTERMFDAVGFRPGRASAIVGGLAEAGGGTLLVLGFLTPLGSFAIVAMMIGAIAAVHLPKGMWNTDGGIEFPALLASVAFALTMTGTGRYSVDHLLGLRWSASWVLALLVAAAIVAVVIVAWLRADRAAAPAEPTATPERIRLRDRSPSA